MNQNASMIDPVSFSQSEIRDMIAEHLGPRRVPKRLNIVADVSDFFRVDYDDVVILDDHPYLIRNYEREGRFGIDEQPKFWVRRALDLVDGSLKIMKMVFLEKFKARVGDIVFECIRSPWKEARILDLVRGHPAFMQGFGRRDRSGNIIRIIDYIHGATIDNSIAHLGRTHEDYYFNHFPSVLDDYIELVQAIKFLHDHGEKHGDIRRDHILKAKQGGRYLWIDFDFNYWHQENMFGYDLFGLGNILVYLVARTDCTIQYLRKSHHPSLGRLSGDDMNIVFNNRVVNLQKIYPYISEALNFILLHFSHGADVFYEDTAQFLNDLYEARESICNH